MAVTFLVTRRDSEEEPSLDPTLNGCSSSLA
ncbi:MAG: hypothetical protein ACI87E_004939, partial [Mariniblastus sp.]